MVIIYGSSILTKKSSEAELIRVIGFREEDKYDEAKLYIEPSDVFDDDILYLSGINDLYSLYHTQPTEKEIEQ